MSYSLRVFKKALHVLEKIKGKDYERILHAIRSLSANPRPYGCKKLSGRDGWRIRVGVYRIIYEIHDRELIVLVVDIGHRREIYRQFE
ncbi:MAG: plasmid stabilization protein [Candidatus Raymondbacteria bacterium RifOxyC12_full_50_8]|uniref:Plasmid stabilization protein n=1 Tax=Candidatus Raymondbacteria bacterium RIFOXYD12_FULL_49_13 TaxID=1817890 RepID=A0A1F7FHX1_UNCRA|nr:MAG: plasmid stabilization protein [Candidatus Raymondbacteria bacterium RIFOXYA2_FULL_49_16]OGJ95705.1 MAG: plasmid stabilization protein [Candidatus Raymondbacteria bacterium RifOxyB12_full_50_8]OGK05933.1 MAG: plasmid stabilization protein [Candidatus Raymondbacteria bacterium RifOxyC12_full_50_8]OGK06290.1 MAG: plasmid stabilization protein [Candidatus Raymondbacteria bacterium RIFOXYD12_FULL_49_13]OGP40622.1 MAG: plasmid stabilization protein [Candidatus Raymondbacteria bacterium RIFOXY